MASCNENLPTQRNNPCRRNSYETLCSSNSSCFLQKRKPPNPLARSIRSNVTISTGNNIKQRVLSAKLLRMRSLQNQLNDANFHLVELAKENRALKTLQKRQDKALSKYEDANADLPRLLKSHQEEIRVLRERTKLMKRSIKELTDQLKIKDEEMIGLREQLKHITDLTKDRHLGEREKLSQQLEDCKDKLKSSEDQVNLLNRKLMLETKNLKHRLNLEIGKNKQYHKDLEQAYTEINRLNSQQGNAKKEHQPSPATKRFTALAAANQRQAPLIGSKSSTDLVRDFSEKLRPLLYDEDCDESEPEDAENVQKAQMKNGEEGALLAKTAPNICGADVDEKVSLKSPTERVRERLLKKGPVPEKQLLIANRKRVRPVSSQKLDKIPSTGSHDKPPDVEDDLCKRMDDCCSDIMASVSNYNEKMDRHKQEYEWSINETEKLLQSLREADKMDSKLRLKKLMAQDVFSLPQKERAVAEEILREECLFRKKNQDKEGPPDDATDSNGNVLKEESKNKLLATLRAIDHGEAATVDVEIPAEGQGKSHLLNELLGDLN